MPVGSSIFTPAVLAPDRPRELFGIGLLIYRYPTGTALAAFAVRIGTERPSQPDRDMFGGSDLGKRLG
jgi:hypothetical protein